MASADLPALAAALRRRERPAVARALNLAEDTRPAARQDLGRLLELLGDDGGCRVGITGPPGAGKSSLLAALGPALRARGESVGVVAVDPSSARTGGALLGDRARMSFDPTDDGLFMRSVATAGHAGGLARGAAEAAQILSAAFDWTFLETTGVGQSEVAVEHAVDLVVLVMQPGGGDLLQFIKAGVMEIPDLFVVGKADHGERAERTYGDLRAALASLCAAGVEAEAPVLKLSAHDGSGIDALCDALTSRAAEGLTRRAERRLRAATERALAELRALHGEFGVTSLGGEQATRESLAEQLQSGESVPVAVAAASARVRQGWARGGRA